MVQAPQQIVMVQAPRDEGSDFAIGCLLTWCCTGIFGIICYACFSSQHFIAGYLVGLGGQFVTVGIIILVVQGGSKTQKDCEKELENKTGSCSYMPDAVRTIYSAIGAVLLVVGVICIGFGIWRKMTIAPPAVMIAVAPPQFVVAQPQYVTGQPQQQSQDYVK